MTRSEHRISLAFAGLLAAGAVAGTIVALVGGGKQGARQPDVAGTSAETLPVSAAPPQAAPPPVSPPRPPADATPAPPPVPPVGPAGPVASSPTPMRIVFHGYKNGTWRTGTGIITEEWALSGATDLPGIGGGAELSPGGGLIAWEECDADARGIYAARVDGSDPRRLVSLPAGDRCAQTGTRWSPDGRYVSYVAPEDGPLHLIDVAGGAPSRIADGPLEGWYSWSPGGAAIVYGAKRAGKRQLDVVEFPSGATRELTNPALLDGCEDAWAPAWSPRGDAIAFQACDDLYVVSPDGSGLARLAGDAYGPRWSLDGQWILFCRLSASRRDDTTRGELYRVSRDGGRPARVGRLPYAGFPFSLGPVAAPPPPAATPAAADLLPGRTASDERTGLRLAVLDGWYLLRPDSAALLRDGALFRAVRPDLRVALLIYERPACSPTDAAQVDRVLRALRADGAEAGIVGGSTPLPVSTALGEGRGFLVEAGTTQRELWYVVFLPWSSGRCLEVRCGGPAAAEGTVQTDCPAIAAGGLWKS